MAYAISDLALYTSDFIENWGQCPWRKFMRSLSGLSWGDLNYYSADLTETCKPLNTWIDADEIPFTPESFPFVLYNKINLDNQGARPKLVIVRTLDQLYNDPLLAEYVSAGN